jgi:hypothetical protein
VQISFSFSDCREPLILDETEAYRCIVVGRVRRLLTITCSPLDVQSDGDTQVWDDTRAWLELHLYDDNGQLDEFHKFKSSKRCYYVPLGWGGWTVAKRVSVVHLRESCVLNHRVEWDISDQP